MRAVGNSEPIPEDAGRTIEVFNWIKRTLVRSRTFTMANENNGYRRLLAGAGRARAKAQGVRFGRPPSLTPHQRREAIERLAQGAAQAELDH